MFSSRLDWKLGPNRLALLLVDKRRAGIPILDLTESNPTRAGFHYDPGIVTALAGPASLRYEPAPAGSLHAREAVAGYYAGRGPVVYPDRIILSSSTSESYSWLFKLLADPGDEILVPRPSYPLFEYLGALESVRIIQYPLVYHGGWSIDLDRLRSLITSRTGAVVVVNPNNPTGSFLKRDEVEALASLEIPVIADEVFCDYRLESGPGVTSLVGESLLSFSLSGLSKSCGLPQMKLGWIVMNGTAYKDAHARLELIADSYLSVATPVQNALPQMLALGSAVRVQIQARVAANLRVLKTILASHPDCELLRVEGGWYATVRVPQVRSEEQWCLDLLNHQNVLVQPGFFYDFESEAYLVLSLLTAEDVFAEGVQRIWDRIPSGCTDHSALTSL